MASVEGPRPEITEVVLEELYDQSFVWTPEGGNTIAGGITVTGSYVHEGKLYLALSTNETVEISVRKVR